MINKKKSFSLRSLLVNIGLLLFSSIMFALAFPNALNIWGFFPIAFVCFFPMFLLIHRTNWVSVWFYGALFGFLSYAIFNYWLVKFHPLAIFIVPIVYVFYFLLFFPVLKIVDRLFPKYGFFILPFVWVGFEYLKTLGFLGYPYGIIGYSQYLFLPFARLASLTGVWGVSLLVVFPSSWIYALLKNGFSKAKITEQFTRLWKWGLGFIVLFAVVLVYGVFSSVDYSESPTWNVALVQQNIDPWRGGIDEYEKTFEILSRQTDLALEEHPDTDIVIWSETSFVPGIDYNTRNWTDLRRRNLVNNLIDYLATLDVPLVLGNDDARLVVIDDESQIIHYNATLMWDKGSFVEEYRKIHLVPFTESFPYQKQFPWMYELLQQTETPFWAKGTDYVVFDAADVKFSTNICFEDVFGYLSRNFVLEGSQVLVNMSNDSWANSIVCEMQHMSIGLFRAIENNRTVVRSTQGGITISVDPNGKILDIMEPFKEGYLYSKVPIYDETTTLYTRWGDWLGQICLYGSILLIFLTSIYMLFKKGKSR